MLFAAERQDRTAAPDLRRESVQGTLGRLWSAIWTLIGRAPAQADDETSAPPNWRRLAGTAVLAGFSLVLIAVGQGLGRAGSEHAAPVFWSASLALVLTCTYAALRPESGRLERLINLIVLGQSLHLLKIIYSPTIFAGFDEYLHFRTALDIFELHALFANNPLLPVSPLYPGLELVTVSMAALTGLGIFPVAIILVALIRFVSVATCFLLFEAVSGSSRLATIGVLVTMSSTSFVSFHGQYAYETLAFAFFLLVLYCTLRLESATPYERRRLAALALLLLPAISITHHLTSYLTAALVTGAVLLMVLRPVPGQPRALALLVAAAACIMPPLWKLIVSAPMGDYVGPHLLTAFGDLKALLSGTHSGRQLFIGVDGVQAPLVLRVIGIMSILVIGIGLLFGFFRALTFRRPGTAETGRRFRTWPSSAVVLLALLGASFPATVIFKLTSAGWEVGNRLGTFAMIGAAFVCGLSVTHFWHQRLPERAGRIGLATVLSLTIVGGMFNGWGAALRSGYQVAGDGLSMEPLGLAVAEWSREVLGEGNRFVADRTNAIFASTFGRQIVLSTLNGDPATADLYFGDRFGYYERNIISNGFVNFILVDRRLPSAAPKVGHYYEPGDLQQNEDLPPRQRDLTKFDHSNEIDRVLDAGAILVYDVSKIRK
ncbi:MAG: hypothetical protein J0I42_19850 [Bosea sp.]|uniref:hypothetical protein n=1 Tax=Bosea sp. (in: a-proteobacteria) TaxID=1871050 RepID=UPI001AD0981C|nr:hypothetical protein [Bosea sp. (in: a-proteobacteria)]MBN9454198.1 hypothetical protein [Bosea sp. (in: a-proteobacteria)]